MPNTVDLTLNQVVAYNIARLRWERRWSEEETAKKVAALCGHHISVASYSAMERSVEGKRVKRFDADEIFGFARVFGVQLWSLLVPPINYKLNPVRIRARGAPARAGLGRAAVLVLLVPSPDDLLVETATLVERKTGGSAEARPASKPEPPFDPVNNPLDRENLRIAANLMMRPSPQSAPEEERQRAEMEQMFRQIVEGRRQGPRPNEKKPRRPVAKRDAAKARRK